MTRFELLFAALHALLARYGNRGTPVGVALSTRTPDQADRIGLFVNELPVAADPAGGTFRDHARAVRSRLREVYRYRAVPLAHAVSGLRPAPALTPVSIGYRRRGGEPAFPGVAGEVDWTLFCGAARNALHAQIVDAPTGITVSLQHSPSAIDTEAVRRIGGHLRTLLTAAVADPDRPVTDLPVLPPTSWTGSPAPGTTPPGRTRPGPACRPCSPPGSPPHRTRRPWSTATGR